MEHPDPPVAEIRQRRLVRIKESVEMAYADIPVYRDKYPAAGFHPDQFWTQADIQKIPVITKPELIAAFPGRCLNPRFRMEDLFPTRPSGSSGQTLLIRVDPSAKAGVSQRGLYKALIAKADERFTSHVDALKQMQKAKRKPT